MKKTQKKTQTKKAIQKNANKQASKSKDFGGRKLRVIMIVLICLVLAFFAVIIYTSISVRNSIIIADEYTATINVSDYVGFNLDKDKLHFGTAFPGGMAAREIEINTSSDKDSYIYVVADKEFKDWIYVSAQNQIIPKIYTLHVKMKVPTNITEVGYEFKIHIYVLDKKVNCFSKLFFKGSAANLEETGQPVGSAKVGITIVNPADKNKSVN